MKTFYETMTPSPITHFPEDLWRLYHSAHFFQITHKSKMWVIFPFAYLLAVRFN